MPPLYVPRYADFTRFVISIYRLYVYHDIRTLLGLSSVYTASMCTTIYELYWVCHQYIPPLCVPRINDHIKGSVLWVIEFRDGICGFNRSISI